MDSADRDFLEFYLETGQGLLLFDGLDELPNSNYKEIVRDRINTFSQVYPGNTLIVTSRIVGYEHPFRFDTDEFSHYRLASLGITQLEQFIHDWYRARIENKADRDRNIRDLIRIMNDDNHTAIRELAENPLLLTIVTLVHRIDAVLPDERVVLYQKCTETLLNTWHTWKYRDIEVKNRGKIERRNRVRMEAIAHWMQCRSAAGQGGQRAIVSYNDLHRFLEAHILTKENLKDDEKEPGDLAHEFLEFVKKRAGLMIEAGDAQYSFVHLTFQEYLTANFLINNNELGGAPAIWNALKKYSGDPKWHEVTRLLVAGLKSNDSQEYLVQHIIETHRDDNSAAAVLS